MDIFKQRRYLLFLVVLLVVLNLGTITLLWIGRPPAPDSRERQVLPHQQDARLKDLLKRELKFNDEQIARYFQLRENHRQQFEKLNEEIRQLKQQMFDAVFSREPQPEISDSLLQLSLQKQAQLDRLTYQHFLDLKKLCNPDQQDQLKMLIGEFFRQQGAPQGKGQVPPPPGRSEGTPPPPGGKMPPPAPPGK